jgi:hypothetical protein
VFLWLANWWDGVDLWLTQLSFPFQFVLVMVVLLPLCLAVAWAIDRLVDVISSLVTRVRDAEPPVAGAEPGAEPAEPVEPSAAEPEPESEPRSERHTVDS